MSLHGNLRLGKKSDLLACLETYGESEPTAPADVDVILLDGAAVVNMLKPGTSKTFDDYSQGIFIPYIKKQLQIATRVEVIWDRYFAQSLKSYARENRGTGSRIKVEG